MKAVLQPDGTVTYSGTRMTINMPIAQAELRDGCAVIAKCPYCGQEHRHCPHEGTRVVHCRQPWQWDKPYDKQYYVKLKGSTRPLFDWGDDGSDDYAALRP
jgi:hypothetical protein